MKLATIFDNIEFILSNLKRKRFYKIIISIVFMCVFVIIVILTARYQYNNRKFGYVLSFILQAIMGFPLFYLVKISVNDNSKAQWQGALAVNLFFAISSTMFIFKYSILANTVFQIICLVILLIILLIMNCKIDKKGDLSYFKAINIFIGVILSALIFFLKKHTDKEASADLIDFYFLLPLMMLQGFYELLERKTTSASPQNNEVKEN